MRLADLTHLILNLNHLVDYGFHDDVSLDEVVKHIEANDVLDLLEQKFKAYVDFAIETSRPGVREGIELGLSRRLRTHKRREHRKWTVRYNGICLLIALTSELTEEGAWNDARVH
jgi:hypothetical protein